MKFAVRLALQANSSRSNCRRDTTKPSWNCTSNKARCWSGSRFLSALSRTSLPRRVFEVQIEGSGGHAGGVLMPDRRDALCAAAELILAIENAARTSGAVDTVATVGICDVFPGAVNSIPSRVRLTVDLRDTDLPRRDLVMRAIEATCHSISAKRHVMVHSELVNADAPADCAPAIIEALSQSCRKHRTDLHSYGQSGLSRLAIHGAYRSGCDVVHPLPQRIQPPP